MEPERLIDRAREAADRAIAPYSEYRVGAALATRDGEVYGGCNFEVANYSNSLHAEEVALARALFDGADRFEAIAVARADGDGPTPCGSCRQTLREFCEPSLDVFVDRRDPSPAGDESPSEEPYDAYRLDELLPAAFAGEGL